MSIYVTVNEAPASPAAPAVANKQVRVYYNELDGGQVSGPFTADQAAAFSVAAITKPGVLRAKVEDAV